MNNIIKDLLINFNLKGYKYLRLATILVLKNYNNVYNVNSLVYALLAKRYKTTCLNIERNIRYIIKTYYTKVKSTFNLLNYPTSSELIAELVEFIKILN